ncbi:MAG: nucleotide exchange factor GrpE [Tannerellaceae bacterium]|nr:nucleotide exchange factor GrpE [Tannerellaceae bacterium]
MNNNKDMETKINDEELNKEDATLLQPEAEEQSAADKRPDNVADNCDPAQKLEELNDAHLRLRAEFDNYRKRTLREKAELIKSGGEASLTALLPVIDDLERALANIRKAEDVESVKEGVELIYNKFAAYLSQQGVKPIEAAGLAFDADKFEAIAIIPAPEAEMKGKVIDCVQTGYTLYDKIIRHAKVVVGE